MFNVPFLGAEMLHAVEPAAVSLFLPFPTWESLEGLPCPRPVRPAPPHVGRWAGSWTPAGFRRPTHGSWLLAGTGQDENHVSPPEKSRLLKEPVPRFEGAGHC